MADFKHKVNRGSAFRNNNKQTNNEPDFTGSCNIAGIEYLISVWSNPSANGKQGYFSYSFMQKDTTRD